MHHDELRGNPMKHLPRLLVSIGAALASGAACAHGGHGLTGAHWHATDVWGWVALAAAVAAAVWFARRK
jgi:hypothetical protein